jgi:hypothetical protein
MKLLFMRWISFFSRVAFICNIAFVLCVLLQGRLFLRNQALVSTLVVAGYVLAPFVFTPVVNLLYATVLVRKKPLFLQVPKWLVVVNFSFLLVQLLFVLFFLHDPIHS